MSRWPFAAMLVAASVGASSLFAPGAVAGDDLAAAGVRDAAAIMGNANWSLRLPQDGQVVYRGLASFDEAGTGSASFLYPAPNAGGLIVAVLTHGLLVESAKKDQKDKLQAAADTVLLPYKGVVDNFNHLDLMRRALAKTSTGGKGKLIESSANPGPEMLVESAPVFSLTQDQNAIILDNVVAILMPGAAPGAAYRNTLRIISTAAGATDPVAFWTANDGEKLKDQSAQLVAESLDIAFGDAAAGTNREGIPYRTIRYREGTAEKIERAQVLSNRCDRLVIRNLRGAVMSVPVAPVTTVASAADHCEPGTIVGPK